MALIERTGRFEGVWRSEGYFNATLGLSLYYQQWIVEPAQNLVIVHGGGEHSSRYTETAVWLNQEGFAVHAFDLPGHGRSPGKRGHIQHFEEYVGALEGFIRFVRHDPSSPKPILLGHSLGGLISTFYAVRHPDTICCLILSSPLWGLNIHVPLWKRALSHGVSRVWPSLIMRRPSSGATVLSHDPEVGVRYLNDPLVHFKASARFYVELRRRFKQLPEAVSHLKIPVLILQAGDDRIASAEATARIFPQIGSNQKKLITYDGYYHEVLNEVGREAVLRDLVGWLRSFPGGRAP